MKSAGLAVILVAAAAPASHAGTYVGLGIGSAAGGHVGSDASSMKSSGDRSGRFVLGMRWGHLSIEGAATRYTQLYRNAANDATQLAAALKVSVPVAPNIEAFGRGGLQRTDLSSGLSGDGWLLGGGFEYRLELAGVGASIFVDYTHNQTSFGMGPHEPAADGTASMFTLGLTVSI